MTIGQSRAAFTLIEVLIVIVLIGLLFAAIVPTLNDQGGDLNEAARWMRTVISMARAEAMNESARYRLEFDADGQMRVLRQEDPLTAPDAYVPVEREWARLPQGLTSTWIEAVALLPVGPPPIEVNRDQSQFEVIDDVDTFDVAFVPTAEFEAPQKIDFEPDGSSGSARWIVRDTRGIGLQLTLDGRIGRLEVIDAASIPADQLQRPARRAAER